jgi:hypothetical protein
MNHFKSIKNIFLLAVSTVFLCACQELYLEDTLDSSQKIPVIQGAISDQPGPYRVALSWAKPFNSKSVKRDGIKNAQVFILDDAGNSEKLTEATNGEYYTSAQGIKGITGRTYHVHIQFPDGTVFESVPARLEQPAIIDSLYAETGEYVYGYTSTDNQFVKKVYQGLYVYADIKFKSDETKYIKSENTTIWQAASIPKSISEKTKYFRIVINSDDLPNVKEFIKVNDDLVVKKQQIAFVYNYLNDSANKSDYRNAGWILCPTFKTISKEVYNYYQNVNQQLGAGLQIFDPIPIQIRGNVNCISDPGQVVNGIFEVSAKTKLYKAFYWSSASNVIKTKKVDDPGPIANSTHVGLQPPYWIIF